MSKKSGAFGIMEIKFFWKDVISGHPGKVGDEFTASFMGCTRTFVVTSHHGEFFFAELVD